MAGDVVDVLEVASQLTCVETGRPACGQRRPASLNTAEYAVQHARSDHLQCLGRELSRAKRREGCWRGGKQSRPRGRICRKGTLHASHTASDLGKLLA